MLHIPPTSCLLLTAKQKPYKKAYLLTKNIEECSGKSWRKGQQVENDKTERVTGTGRRTREEIAKWNQMTALRFQTGGRHQTSPASLRGCPDDILWTTKHFVTKHGMVMLQNEPECHTKQKLFAVFKVKVTARAHIIKTLLRLLYLLNCWFFGNQTWFDDRIT